MSENKQYGLDEWVHHPDVRITINKYPQETQEDAKLRRFKEKWLFIATLIALVIELCYLHRLASIKNRFTICGHSPEWCDRFGYGVSWLLRAGKNTIA